MLWESSEEILRTVDGINKDNNEEVLFNIDFKLKQISDWSLLVAKMWPLQLFMTTVHSDWTML